jgi:hypothetical protein
VPGNGSAQLFSHRFQACLVICQCTPRDVVQDRLTAQFPTSLGACDERIRFDLSRPEPREIILRIRFRMVAVPGVGQARAAAGFEIVYPGQPVRLDELIRREGEFYRALLIGTTLLLGASERSSSALRASASA